MKRIKDYPISDRKVILHVRRMCYKDVLIKNDIFVLLYQIILLHLQKFKFMFSGNSTAKPFVKWVGGKRQLLSQLATALPMKLREEPFAYIEPFVGSGAMLFFMLQRFPNIRKVVINDINRNLTETYKTIKHDPEGLIYRLKHIEQQYLSIKDYEQQRQFYLEMRLRFNYELPSIKL